jgi:hypothetical protein
MAANVPHNIGAGGGGQDVHNPDQTRQVVQKLERKRDSIKNLLRMLSKSGSSSNNSKSSSVSPGPAAGKSNTKTSASGAVNGDNSDNNISGDNLICDDFNTRSSGEVHNIKVNGVGERGEGISGGQDPIGYEQLWQLGTPGTVEDNISEVTETEDILDDLPETEVDAHDDDDGGHHHYLDLTHDDREMYANTSIFVSASATVDVEVPPPLPPRLPSSRHHDPRALSEGSDISSSRASKCVSQSELGRASHTTSQSELSTSKSVSQSALLVGATTGQETGSSSSSTRQITGFSRGGGGQDFETFSGGAVDCSSPHPSLPLQATNRSCVTSTPKDQTSEPNKTATVQELKQKREELLERLQSEEQERRWYYSQLQLIAQKISSIPPTSPNSVSLCL